MAGRACYKPGQRVRLIYAIREHRGRKGELKGFGWRDFRDLVVRQYRPEVIDRCPAGTDLTLDL